MYGHIRTYCKNPRDKNVKCWDMVNFVLNIRSELDRDLEPDSVTLTSVIPDNQLARGIQSKTIRGAP